MKRVLTLVASVSAQPNDGCYAFSDPVVANTYSFSQTDEFISDIDLIRLHSDPDFGIKSVIECDSKKKDGDLLNFRLNAKDGQLTLSTFGFDFSDMSSNVFCREKDLSSLGDIAAVTIYMTNTKLVGMLLQMTSGASIPIGSTRAATQTKVIPIQHRLVGFQAMQTYKGDINMIGTIEYTCGPPLSLEVTVPQPIGVKPLPASPSDKTTVLYTTD